MARNQPYVRLDKNGTTVLLVDYQTGLLMFPDVPYIARPGQINAFRIIGT